MSRSVLLKRNEDRYDPFYFAAAAAVAAVVAVVVVAVVVVVAIGAFIIM